MTMGAPSENATDFTVPDMIEGFANVVAIDGAVAWLEPEQSSGCGICTSSDTCCAKGIGTVANRLEVRRFPLANNPGLKVGDRVVVGVRENALITASMTVYALPLATMFAAGFLVQWGFDSDDITMAATVAGLGAGFAIARLRVRAIAADGEMAPQFLRLAAIGEACHN